MKRKIVNQKNNKQIGTVMIYKVYDVTECLYTYNMEKKDLIIPNEKKKKKSFIKQIL